MADAKALYKRHIKEYSEAHKESSFGGMEKACAILYAACIIAEAIRNSMDETE